MPTSATALLQLGKKIEVVLGALDLEQKLDVLREVLEKKARPVASPDQVRQGTRWYLGGLACVGVAVGLFAGLSYTPIVATLLPIVFGLVAAGGGYYFSNQVVDPARARLLGFGLIAFVVPTIVAVLIGISIRTQVGIFDMRPRLFTPAPSRVAEVAKVDAGDRSAEYIVRLAQLRSRLVALGSTTEEVNAALSSATKLMSEPHKLSQPRLVAALDEARAAVQKTAPSSTDATALLIVLDAYHDEFAGWQEMSVLDVDGKALADRLTEILDSLSCSSEGWKGQAAVCEKLRATLVVEKAKLLRSPPINELLRLTDAPVEAKGQQQRDATRGLASQPTAPAQPIIGPGLPPIPG